MITKVIDLDEMNVIKWRITDCCNYQCSYCIRHYFTGKSQNLEMMKEDYAISLAVAPEISRIMDEMGKPTKLDLIGGEVSLFDLKEIFKKITSNNFKKVNITTNLSMSADYYNDIYNYLKSRDIKFNLVASFHPDCTDLDTFINKLKEIKADTFKIEMVSLKENQSLVKIFIDKAKSNNLDYMVEADLRYGKEQREGLIVEANKVQTKPRYKIIYDDGKEEYFMSRNSFLQQDIPEIKERMAFHTNGYLCSRDYSYVYIEKGIHMGNLTVDSDCKQIQLVSEFHPLKERRRCKRDYCTLCGHISIEK